MGLACILAALGVAAAPAADPILLRAGPLRLVFEPEQAFVRHLRVGSDEVLRGISAPVRNRFWGTVPPEVSNVVIEQQPDGFTLSFDVRCREREVDFRWHGTLVGKADGSLDYTFDGEALADFERNRIGFCVLHGEKAAGRPWRLEKTDGTTEDGRFPDLIAPHQPAKDLRAVAHEFAPGRWVRVVFEGDVFEMEDQRNWTDASFKTYCTPLALPYPVPVPKGTAVRQKITLALTGDMPAAVTAEPEPAVDVGDAVANLPGIGVRMSDEAEALGAREATRLAALHPDHLRVDLAPGEGGLAARLRRAKAQAGQLGCPLLAAVHLGSETVADLQTLVAECRSVRPPVGTWLVIGADADAFIRVRDALREIFPEARFGVGHDTNFTELNRDRPDPAEIEVAAYGMNPQVHAFDEASIIETLPIQAETVRTARDFLGGVPVVVSPLSLRVQAVSREPLPGELPMNVDPRQASPFAAAWTLGSIASLAGAGVDAVTFFETVGRKGLVASGSGDPVFPAGPGEAYPVYHVLRAVGDFAGGRVRRAVTNDPASVVALALERDGRELLLVANLTARPRSVAIRGVGPDAGVRLLQAAAAGLDDDAAWPATAGRLAAGGALHLPAYGIARIEPADRMVLGGGPVLAAACLCLAVASGVVPLLRPWSFALWVVAAVVVGLVFPAWFISVGDFRFTSLFKPLLMLIMFCMGATLSADDFARVARMPVGVAVGLLCQFTVMPLLGYTVATAFRFPPEVAAGIVLVGVAPSGLASNVMSYIARANVALSVTITALASLLSPLLTPLLMQRLAGEMITIDAPAMMLDIAQMVLVPILAGLAFHHLAADRRRWIEPVLPAFSMAGIIAMTVLTVAVGRDNLLKVGPLLLVACLVHNLGGYLLGYLATRALGQDRLSARTVAIEVGMQNCGLASGLAAALGKVATLGLAPIIFGPIMNTSASILANWWRTRPVKGGLERIPPTCSDSRSGESDCGTPLR